MPLLNLDSIIGVWGMLMNKVCAWVRAGFPTRTNNYHYNERYFLIRVNYPYIKECNTIQTRRLVTHYSTENDFTS